MAENVENFVTGLACLMDKIQSIINFTVMRTGFINCNAFFAHSV